MAAGIILRIPCDAAGPDPARALERFLSEEADGLFTHVLFDKAVGEKWLDFLESGEQPTALPVFGILGSDLTLNRGERDVSAGRSSGVHSETRPPVQPDQPATCAARLGQAFSHGFAGQSAVPIHRALADTLESRSKTCVTHLPETTDGAAGADAAGADTTGAADAAGADATDAPAGAEQRLHDSVASSALPDTQRREILRCMYGVLCAASGLVAVSPDVFVAPDTGPPDQPGPVNSGESSNTGQSANSGESSNTGQSPPAAGEADFEQLAAALGTPGTLTFDLWNDCLALIRARRSRPALAEDTGESLLEAGDEVVAMLRGAQNAPAPPQDSPSDTPPVLILANASSDVAEARIDARALPNNISSAMTDLLTGDTVFVPPSGDHIFSIDLEAYEVMWLELSQDSS